MNHRDGNAPIEEIPLEGLSADVEIIVDRYGIPHIYASSREDVFIAQGFNAARDRLFQMDLWRRRGNGELAEVLGPEYVEQDRANRLFLYRGDMEDEWAAYAPGTREAVQAFSHGVNAYIAWANDDPVRLPPEFELYGYRPGRWDAAQTVRFRTHGLFYNAEQEVARARTTHLAGMEAELIRQAREPDGEPGEPAVDPGLFGPETLRTYQLAFAPVDFAGAADPDTSRESTAGSNNWVVDGSRTGSGRPVLANDPHRAITQPSLRYIAHLSAPDLDVIGAGEPGLPGISIGHNGRVGFGLTIWPADVEDLFVYRLDPDDVGRYYGPDGSTAFTAITEDIRVRGEQARTVSLPFTVHGPVIHVDRERGIAVALRAAWLEPGMAPYLASIGYDDAATGAEFVEALRYWGAPAVNHVFASTDGDWGWQVAAKIPRRAGWDGSSPVPGDGTHEWTGYATAPDLPAERRPERGWVATANEQNLTPDFLSSGLTATHDWYSSARADRLARWLGHDDNVTVESSARMQMDELSVHALRVISMLDHLDASAIPHPEFAALRSWDGREGTDSREALVFQIWLRRHLRPRLVDERLRAEGLTADARNAARALVMKDESFGGDLRGDIRLFTWLQQTMDAATAEQLVAETLAAALGEIEELLGAEAAENPWSWGRLHHSSVSHAAFTGRDDVPDEWARSGPLPRAGSGDTVGMAGYDASFRQSIGSTFRVVVDVGAWDASVAMNSPGQSGDPRSAHYRDLFEQWVHGETFPLAYTRAAVDAAAERRIILRASCISPGGCDRLR